MRRSDLVPDCASCAALCCVATSFDASEDFAFSKRAGERCRYLLPDCRCAIHADLAARGFRGCAVYDCYGAGQRATREYAGQQETFLVLHEIHELLWLLTEAMKLCPAWEAELHADFAREIAALDAVAPREENVPGQRSATSALLARLAIALGGMRGSMLPSD
jgi:hypothetical protein